MRSSSWVETNWALSISLWTVSVGNLKADHLPTSYPRDQVKESLPMLIAHPDEVEAVLTHPNDFRR